MISEYLERKLWSQMVTPVIIEAKLSKFIDISKYIKSNLLDYISKIKSMLPKRSEITSLFEKFVELPKFSMLSVPLPRELVFDLENLDGIENIYYNHTRYCVYSTVSHVFNLPTSLVRSHKIIKCTSTYEVKKILGLLDAYNNGINGTGIYVGIPDTGSYPFRDMKNVKRESVIWNTTDYDCGHGTWCASAIASNYTYDWLLYHRYGIKIPIEGMAPNSRVYAVRCMDYIVGIGSTDAILKAIELCVFKYSCDIISMSIGSRVDFDNLTDDAMYKPLKKIYDMGVIPVCAAGNMGPNKSSITSPGCIPEVLTVGAYDPITGEIARFSSRGPIFNEIKPDCVAPGVNIYAHASGILDRVDGMSTGFSPLSGTSMATPIVAGLLACMKQLYNSIGLHLTVDEIKKMLSELGHEKTNVDGWGEINWYMVLDWLETEYSIRR